MDYIIVALFGASIGSFLGVIVDRMHEGTSFVRGRSRCMSCHKILSWFENIPLVSYILQRGRCRHCKSRIPFGVLGIEIATAALFCIVYVVFITQSAYGSLLGAGGIVWAAVGQLVWLWFVTAVLVLIFVYDLQYYLILDVITLPAIVIIFLVQFFYFEQISWQSMLLGAAIAGGFFLLQFVVSRGTWIGGGDIRLGVLMGVLLGWKAVLVALALAYMSGAVIGIALLISGKKDMQSAVPFGAFLAPATWIVLLWGERIIDWYLSVQLL